jgi:hypothetical protein
MFSLELTSGVEALSTRAVVIVEAFLWFPGIDAETLCILDGGFVINAHLWIG